MVKCGNDISALLTAWSLGPISALCVMDTSYMKRRSGLQMTFRLGQANDINLFCVYTLPYHYFIRVKICSKRSVKIC